MATSNYDPPPTEIGQFVQIRVGDRAVTLSRRDETTLNVLSPPAGERVAEAFEDGSGNYTLKASGAGIRDIRQPASWDELIDALLASAAGVSG